MASRYKFDVCHGIEFEARDGGKKRRWTKIGAAFQDDETGRISMKIDYFPVGSGPVFLSLFEPVQKDGNGSQSGGNDQAKGQASGMDDVPF